MEQNCFFSMCSGIQELWKKVLFESSFEIEGEKYISIGNNVCTKPRLHIACINKIEIGDGTLLGSKIFITDHFHGETTYESMNIPPSYRILTSRGPVIIGKNVWIGEGGDNARGYSWR